MSTANAAPVPPETLAAILARHRLGRRTVQPLPHPGRDSLIYLLGDDLILRVPINDPPPFVATQTEAVAVPVARAVGVRAPALIAVDVTGELIPGPYLIYERLPGVPFAAVPEQHPQAPEVWRAVGHDLALLHTRVSRSSPAGRLWPDTPFPDPDPRPWLAELAEGGTVPPGVARDLFAWLERLAPATMPALLPCFTHGDVQVGNLMVAPAGDGLVYQGLVDWGGAGWGDPLWDFAAVALRAVPLMLDGYQAVAPVPGLPDTRARIAWRHLQLGLFLLRRGTLPDPAQRAARLARLLDGLAFLLDPPP
jgi:aminoglycoside phosphotransferase (APT) family kinase protein